VSPSSCDLILASGIKTSNLTSPARWADAESRGPPYLARRIAKHEEVGGISY